MKKLASLLLAAAMLFALTACGENSQPAEYNEDIEDAPLSIYFLNAEPEADEFWQKLALEYSEQSGVPVTVLSPAQGEYEQIFAQEMNKVKSPSIFQCSREGLKGKENFCYDLSGAEFLNEQLLPLNIVDEEGRILSAGYSYGTYGLLVNSALLVQSGHSFDDITSFEGLREVADDIHARREELGFDAFIPVGLEDSSAFCFSARLANMPLYYQFRDKHISLPPETVGKEYLENFKNLWDLFTADSSADSSSPAKIRPGDSLKAFAEGKAVFHMGSSEDYSRLISLKADIDSIKIRPLKLGVDDEEFSGLCSGTDRYLAVNNECTQEEIQAAVDFINWLASPDAAQMLCDYFGASLFKASNDYENPFLSRARSYIDEGFNNIDWVYTMAPNAEQWQAELSEALIKYTSGSADWTAVEKVFTEGWAAQYGAEHSGD